MQDYIRYNFEMLKGAKTLFDNVRDYADRIVAEPDEPELYRNDFIAAP